MHKGAWEGYSPWGHKELDMTEQLGMHACMPGLFMGLAQCRVQSMCSVNTE